MENSEFPLFNDFKNELKENRELMIKLCESVQEMFSQINQISAKTKSIDGTNFNYTAPAHTQINPIHPQENPTVYDNIPANPFFFKSSNTGNLRISTGNQGVPADRQTNQQTDRQIENSIENAAEMLKSLDNLKKEIYQKFKKLTEQEWLVFLTIYQFDEEKGYSDYRVLAEKLNLTESSIRDYVARLINKGIPLDKVKLNNKNIRLNISQSLKQIASLSTLLYLRDL